MTSTPALEEMRRQLEEAADDLPPDVELRFRAMFGGVGAYAYDRMFASLSNVGLALKLPAEAQAALLREEGARRLRYEADGPESKQYVVVPPALRTVSAAFGPWVRRSVEHVATLPAPKRRRKAPSS